MSPLDLSPSARAALAVALIASLVGCGQANQQAGEATSSPTPSPTTVEPTNAPATASPPVSTAPPFSPNPLGQPFHVTKPGPDGYDGLVNAFFSTEVHATDANDGTPHVFYMFEIRVSSTKGKIPTSEWSIETANPDSVVHQDHDVSVTDNSKTPPLASNSSGNTGGYIAFDVPPPAMPTTLNLRDPSSSNALIAQWKLGQPKS